MRAAKMTKSISIARLLLAPIMACVPWSCGSCRGTGNYRSDVQLDGTNRIPEPAGRERSLFVGLRV